MRSLDIELHPTIKCAIKDRRKKLLLTMYILSFIVFLMLGIKDLSFGLYKNFFLDLFTLALIATSYLIFFLKENYEIASHSILFIVGIAIIYAITMNNFNNLTPIYIIPFIMSVFFLFSWKKGFFLNLLYCFIFIICIFLTKDFDSACSFMNDDFAFVNFIAVITIIFVFIYFYEVTRVDAYKVLLELSQKQEMLYKEINHRVKNNLNIVSSMLSMQAQKESKEVQDIIAVSKHRIESIAMVHSMLYTSNNIEKINAKSFIEKLCLNLIDTMKSKIKVVLSIKELVFPLNEVVPIGLILNELITNSIKYAFLHVKNPTITITLQTHENYILLTYYDNGVGYDIEKGVKLGLTLVKLNVKQLKASMQVKNKSGLLFNIKYKRKIDV